MQNSKRKSMIKGLKIVAISIFVILLLFSPIVFDPNIQGNENTKTQSTSETTEKVEVTDEKEDLGSEDGNTESENPIKVVFHLVAIILIYCLWIFLILELITTLICLF